MEGGRWGCGCPRTTPRRSIIPWNTRLNGAIVSQDPTRPTISAFGNVKLCSISAASASFAGEQSLMTVLCNSVCAIGTNRAFDSFRGNPQPHPEAEMYIARTRGAILNRGGPRVTAVSDSGFLRKAISPPPSDSSQLTEG